MITANKLLIFIFCAVVLSGCSTMSGKDLVNEHAGKVKDHKAKLEKIKSKDKNRSEYVSFENSNYGTMQTIDEKKLLRKKAKWLNKKISLDINNPINADSLLLMLKNKNINIYSNLPLSNYVYRGHGISNLPIDKSLKIIFAQMNLDYNIYYEDKMVEVVPMPWKTYNINIGSRTSSFESEFGTTAESGSVDFSVDGGGGGGEDSGAGTGITREGTFKVKTEDDFWKSLKNELDEKLTIYVPKHRPINETYNNNIFNNEIASYVNGEETSNQKNERRNIAQNRRGQESQELFKEVSVGRYSINPDTGSIHIQAPSWIQEDFGKYFKKLNAKYNTQITFEGYLFQVSNDSNKSRGINITAFTEELEKYDIGYVSNALGGITVQKPDGEDFGNIVPGEGASGPTFGGYREDDGNFLSAFAGYLDSSGKLSTIERPRVTTTSGMPGMFRNVVTEHFNIVSQEVSGTDEGAVATQNTLVPVKLGTIMTVNPRYDPDTGIVRTQLGLGQMHKVGTQTITQVIGNSMGDIDIDVPIISENNYDGEIVLKDGDVIIVGGHTENSSNLKDSGLPKIKRQQ